MQKNNFPLQILPDLGMLVYGVLALIEIILHGWDAKVTFNHTIYNPHAALIIVWVLAFFVFELKYKIFSLFVIGVTYGFSEIVNFAMQIVFLGFMYQYQYVMTLAYCALFIASMLALRGHVRIRVPRNPLIIFPIMYVVLWIVILLQSFSVANLLINNLPLSIVGNVILLISAFAVLHKK